MSFLKGIFGNISKAIIIAIGGGGDIVGASHIYNAFSRDGVRAYLAAIPWERFVNDPIPGPLSLNDFDGNIILRENYGIIIGETYAIHKGYIVIPQVSRVWRILKVPIIVYEASGGYRKLLKGIVDTIRYFDVDTVIGLDVGGDVLATGLEDRLWSPLLDHLALSAINDAVKITGVKGYIGVFGLGADGELDSDTLEEYVSELMKKKGFVGALALSLDDYNLLTNVVKLANTEASLIPLKVFSGEKGKYTIRSGTREIELRLEMLMTLFFTVETVYQHSVIARALKGTETIYEARSKLNSLGVCTELDLEHEVVRLRLKKNTISTKDIITIHQRLLDKCKNNRFRSS